MAHSSVEKLVDGVIGILGTTRKINEDDPVFFYKKLQRYVDSQEKVSGPNKEKGKPREMEFWVSPTSIAFDRPDVE